MTARKPALMARAMQEYSRERLETCDVWPRLISLIYPIQLGHDTPFLLCDTTNLCTKRPLDKIVDFRLFEMLDHVKTVQPGKCVYCAA